MRVQRFLAALVLCAIVFVLLHTLLLQMERRRYPCPYGEEVERWAETYGVPLPLAYAVIKVESDFDPSAVSPADAKGLMQLTDITFDWIRSRIGSEEDRVFDPATNIRYGIYYLSYLYGRFQSWRLALIAYNAGPNRLAEWIGIYGPEPEIPYRETREYVIRVEAAMKKYEKLYFQGEIKL